MKCKVKKCLRVSPYLVLSGTTVNAFSNRNIDGVLLFAVALVLISELFIAENKNITTFQRE